MRKGERKKTHKVDSEDLTGGALHLVEPGEEIPESRLSLDLITGKDSHSVDGRLGLRLRGTLATDDLVLLDLSFGLVGKRATKTRRKTRKRRKDEGRRVRRVDGGARKDREGRCAMYGNEDPPL